MEQQYSIPAGDPPGAHAAPAGMQATRLRLPMNAPCACTDGGNQQVINGDEALTLDASWEATPFRTGDLSAEDDSHVQGVYSQQAADYAGS